MASFLFLLLGVSASLPWAVATSNTQVPSEWQVKESGKVLLPAVDASTTDRSLNEEAKTCSIYMAPSSLKGLQGHGIFTTRDLKKHESILKAPDGPTVVLTDYWNNDGSENDEANRDHWIEQWDCYWWGRGVGDHARFESDIKYGMIDFQPTFGALPNHHCLWATIDHAQPKVPYADNLDLLNASSSSGRGPGAGASSYHMGRDFQTSRALPAGSELFLNYGHCDREHSGDAHEWTQFSKMTQDYEGAADIVLGIWSALYYYEATGTVHEEFEQVRSNGTLQTHQGRPLLEFPLVEAILYLAEVMEEDLSHPVRSLIPTTTGELFRSMDPFVANEGADSERDRFQRLSSSDIDLMALGEQLEKVVATHPRTPEWIREHGMCLEHLVPLPSTIPHAGHGGFAQHYIPKGDIVVPAPLLHILQREVLKIHTTSEFSAEDTQKQDTQLLLNYCWGNPQTTLLLCPITNALLINHCSDRPGFPCPGGFGPNAKIQWANSTLDATTKEWLQMTVEEMAEQPIYQRGLSLEYIATRDIYPADEVFVDYGVEWERAWIKHVEAWNQTATAGRLSVTLLNQKIEQGLPLTHLVAPEEEALAQAADSTHQDEYMMTACMYKVTAQDQHSEYQTKVSWREDYAEDDDSLLWYYADDGSGFAYGGYANHEEASYWPCSVLRLDSEEGEEPTYTVRILASPFHPSPVWEFSGAPRLLTSYPLESIRYFPRPYHSDQHLPSSFRHPMGLSDDMIPEQWKNLAEGETMN